MCLPGKFTSFLRRNFTGFYIHSTGHHDCRQSGQVNCRLILHVGLNHSGYLPEFVTITDGKTSDIEMGRTLQFPQGSIVAIDRGYNDYSWYNQLTKNKIFFVTRLKVNAKFKVTSRRPVLKNKGLTSDQAIKFTVMKPAKECPIELRRIGYRDKETGKHYETFAKHAR